MYNDWQSWAALSIVIATLCWFIWNLIPKRKKSKESACGGSCGCSKKWTEKDFADKKEVANR